MEHMKARRKRLAEEKEAAAKRATAEAACGKNMTKSRFRVLQAEAALEEVLYGASFMLVS